MKYVVNKENGKQFYPVRHKGKLYALCDDMIYYVPIDRAGFMKYRTVSKLKYLRDYINLYTEEADSLTDVTEVTYEFQELLSEVALENEELTKGDPVVKEQLEILKRFIDDSILFLEDNPLWVKENWKSEEELAENGQKDKAFDAWFKEAVNLARLFKDDSQETSLKENSKHYPMEQFEFQLFQSEEGEEHLVISLSAIEESARKEIQLPEQFCGMNVTEVGIISAAGMEKVIIPDTYRGIQTGFHNAKELKHVIISEQIQKIPDECFYGCESLVETPKVSKLKAFGRNAFKGCSALKKIYFGKKLAEIGEGAFAECTSLKKVSVPKSVDTIPASMFENCTALSELQLPDTIQRIERNAFAGCSSLKKLRLPMGLESVDASAFPTGLTLISESYLECVWRIIDNEQNAHLQLSYEVEDGNKPKSRQEIAKEQQAQREEEITQDLVETPEEEITQNPVATPEEVQEDDDFEMMNRMESDSNQNFQELSVLVSSDGNTFVCGNISQEAFAKILPEYSITVASVMQIVFSGNGLYFLEGEELVKVDLISRIEKRIALDSLVAARLKVTIEECGFGNESLIEESICLSYLWEQLGRFINEREEAVSLIGKLLKAFNEQITCQTREESIDIYLGEKMFSIAEIVVYISQKLKCSIFEMVE